MTAPAYAMFRAMEAHLNARLPAPQDVVKVVADLVHASRGTPSESHKAFPEGAFLNHFVLPGLHAFVSAFDGMDAEKARTAPESCSSASSRRCSVPASWTPAGTRAMR